MKTSVGFLLTAAVLAQHAAAQSVDPLRFLPPSASIMSLVSDSAGNLYAGGSLDKHGFVARIPAAGPARVLYKITGSGNDYITSIVLGPAGTIFAVGTTLSPDFPATTPPASLPSMNDPRAFVLKLDANGNLAYATLIGASQTNGIAVAVNANGEALVSGQLVELGAPAFPTTPNAVAGNTDVNTGFLVKLDSTGAKILVAIRGFGLGPVAYDGNDNIFVAGAAYGTATISATPGAFQSTHGLQSCAGTAMVGIACSYQYVAKISSDGTKLLYSTFVTGTFGAVPSALTIDSMGNALVAGTTNSRDYPVTPGAYQQAYRAANMPPPSPPTPHPTIYPPPSTGYLTKLSADGTGLVWSTFFSGTGSETITGLSLDSDQRIVITGRSGSTDLPGAQPVPAGCAPDFSRNLAYVAQLSADATALIAVRYVYGLDAGSTVRLALGPDGTPVVASGDVLRPVDFTASTPLACTIDPADNFRMNHAAPGQLITVFGDDFGDGAMVSLNGIPAPLLFASPQQINVQVPIELASQDVVTLTVQTGDGLSISRPLRIVSRAPSAFLVLQDFDPARTALTCKGLTFSPGYSPVAHNEDGSLNACNNPAASGSILTFYLNGLGVTTPSVTLQYPESGDVLAVEQDPNSPSGVWRMHVRLPAKAFSGALVPLIEGVPLRYAWLGVWVK